MTLQELAARFNIRPDTIRKKYRQKGMPPPYGRTRNAHYGLIHVEWIEDYHALKHAFVSPTAALHFCQDEGLSVKQYLIARLQSVTDNAPGVG